MSVVGFLYPPSDSFIRVGCKAVFTERWSSSNNISGILLDNIIIQSCFKNYKKNSQEFLGVFFEKNRNTYNLIQPMKELIASL